MRIELHIEIMPWRWGFGLDRDDDVFGGQRWLQIGPLVFVAVYDIGNCSDPRDWIGLSEMEAERRAQKYQC